jgi:hypothetical protein
MAISIPAFAKTTPVTPPIVNNKMNPNANNIGVLSWITPSQSVANHENTFTPVGTAITIVAAEK